MSNVLTITPSHHQRLLQHSVIFFTFWKVDCGTRLRKNERQQDSVMSCQFISDIYNPGSFEVVFSWLSCGKKVCLPSNWKKRWPSKQLVTMSHCYIMLLLEMSFHGCITSYYLRQGGNVFARLCLFVCQQDNSKSYGRIFLKFWGYVGNGTNYQWFNFGGDRKESWILDHFEIFVTIAFNGA